MKNKRTNIKEAGITLIALVVTIIVLLILAGVTISITLSERGLLNRTTSAREMKEIAQIQEELQLAIHSLEVDYYKTGGIGTFRDFIFSEAPGKGQEKLKEELGASNVSFDKANYKITYKGLEFSVAEDGTITKVGGNANQGGSGSGNGGSESGNGGSESQTGEIDWDEIKRTAQKHPDQKNSNNIGIDANGNVCNLDLWNYELKNNVFELIAIGEVGTHSCYIPYTNLWSSYTGANKDKVEMNNLVCPQYIKKEGQDYKEVQVIGEDAFFGIEMLTSIKIPSIIKEIGVTAFGDCNSLNHVTAPVGLYATWPSSVETFNVTGGTSISDNEFTYCDKLTSITIPSTVTSIGSEAFCGCNGLTSITIPNSVTSIGEYAFNYCVNLTSITIPNSVTSIGDTAFDNCNSLNHVTAPVGLYSQWPSSVETFEATGGTRIKDDEFSFCSNLTSITIPSSVTSIGDGAFGFCSSLTSITIPNSVTSIDDAAFDYCDSLKHITAPVGLYSTWPTSVETFEGTGGTSIADYEFYNWDKLTSITIPSTVTSIGENAFNDCDVLTNITIPSSVTSIGSDAFLGCDSLSSIMIDTATIANLVYNNGTDALGVSLSSLNNIYIKSNIYNSNNNKINSDDYDYTYNFSAIEGEYAKYVRTES